MLYVVFFGRHHLKGPFFSPTNDCEMLNLLLIFTLNPPSSSFLVFLSGGEECGPGEECDTEIIRARSCCPESDVTGEVVSYGKGVLCGQDANRLPAASGPNVFELAVPGRGARGRCPVGGPDAAAARTEGRRRRGGAPVRPTEEQQQHICGAHL